MPKQKSYRALILCCGRMDRGDDAIGPLCAAALAERKIPTRTMQGETSELLEAWHTTQHVIVVDAIVSKQATPGTLHRFDPSDAAFQPGTGRCPTHGLGLAQALKLAKVLKVMPQTLAILGLEAESFEWAATLSPLVAAGMPALVDAVEAEWKRMVAAKSDAASPGVRSAR